MVYIPKAFLIEILTFVQSPKKKKKNTFMSAVFNARVRYSLFLSNLQPFFHINACPVMSSTLDSIATEIFLWSDDAFSRLLLIAPDVFTVTLDNE